MSIARVRVELRESHNASHEERDRAFKSMLAAFRKQVNEAGIISQYKRKQYYESPGENRNRKRKEAQLERQKEKLRDYFPKTSR